jgi:hypothetical protein
MQKTFETIINTFKETNSSKRMQDLQDLVVATDWG